MTTTRTDSDPQTDARPLEEVLEHLRFAMVGTPDGGVWKSRPLTMAGQSGGALHFLVSDDAHWVMALGADASPATVTFSDPHKNEYVALQGQARVLTDPTKIRELWNPAAKAYFDGEDDPSIRVLEIDVEYGEYWDAPSGTLGRMLAMARASAGRHPGKEGPVEV